MKKVKVMLSAIAVVAVVGGALAWKAKGQTIYCAEPQNFGKKAGTTACPTFENSTFVQGEPALSYCTTILNSTCTVPVIELRDQQ